jgi:hypothetical protein
LSFKYQSGEEIRKGDKVLFYGNSAEVEFVAEPPGDNKTEWYVQEFGGGVMIKEPREFGKAFLTQTEHTEDLIFVSRAIE